MTTLEPLRAIGLAFAAVAALVVSPVATGTANAHLNRFHWHEAGHTVSQYSNTNTNMTGLVQALVNSNGCSATAPVGRTLAANASARAPRAGC